jgi:hypothetical protein
MNPSILSRLVLIPVFLTLMSCANFGTYSPGAVRTTGTVVLQSDGRGTRVGATITVADARRLAVANRLTGYRDLPPGIARNLARGKPLPPGIAKRYVPDSMLRSLPVRDGHEWRIAGRDLLLVALGTLLVVEVLEDVFE